MTARWTWAAGLVVALGVAPVAADVVLAGRVVKTDRREVYVNLGEGVGVEVGGRIRFKRPIALRHPVTRAAVNDWLPLGDGEVTAVGDQLARIELAPELLTAIKAGDLAEIYVERAEAAPPPPPPPPKPSPDDRPIPTVDPETAQVLQVWRATTGKAIDERIGAWSGWLASHAASPYAEAVRADLEVLRATAEAMTPDRPGGRRALDLHVEHAAPKRALAGGDVPLAFVLADPEQVVAASLHVRTRGQTVFERVELVREHGVYLRGALPAALVAAPGVEYFVEAIGADGSAGAAYASDVAPATIEVDAPALVERFTPTKQRTRLTIIGSYLDFATFDDRKDSAGNTLDRRDRFAETQIDVLYRLAGVVEGVRLGFGAYGGRGGFSEEVWTEAQPAPVIGFQYGFVEAELRLPIDRGPALGLAGRFVAGVGREGFGVGVAGRVRLGDPDATNLSVGVSGVQQVGFLSDLMLETWPAPKVPIGLSVAVTDQPGNGDLGVRLAGDVGYRLRPWVRPTVRVSWQGRTAAHAGVGGGLGLVFDW